MIRLGQIVMSIVGNAPEHSPHIGLVSIDSSEYCFITNMIQLFHQIRPIDALGITSSFTYIYPDKILASTVKGASKHSLSNISLDFRIHILIFFSILIMSLVVALSKNSINKFFSYFWSFTSVILSDYYSLKIESAIDRLLTGVWLMSCTVLLAAISGLLREVMLKPKPIYWIDSWQELANWNHLRIDTFLTSSITGYILNSGSEPMAQNFAKRISLLNVDDFEKGNKTYENDIDYQGIKDGKVAFVDDENILIMIKHYLVTKYDMKDNIDFHITDTYNTMTQLLKE